jgi:hypothetical protein
LLPTPEAKLGSAGTDYARADREGSGGDDLQTRMAKLLPTPRASDGEKGGPNQAGSSGDLMLPSAVMPLLPTPTTQDGANNGGPSQHEQNTPPLNTVVNLLPTPAAADGSGGRYGSDGHQTPLPGAVRLLPTPAVNDMGEGKTVEGWDDWTDEMKARHGNGNGHGASLAIEAQRLLPTPTAMDSESSGGGQPKDVTLTDAVVRTNLGDKENPRHAQTSDTRPGETLSRVRGTDGPQAVRETVGGQDPVPGPSDLLAELREHQGGGGEDHASLASTSPTSEGVSGLRNVEASARASRGPEPGEQQPVESDDAVRVMPPQASLAGGPRCPYGCGATCGGHSTVAWGDYEPAIRRWEVALGRPSPNPTQTSSQGNPQLAPPFVEHLMGLPAGHVTEVPDMTRNEMLKALGNGVVPQQVAAAVEWILTTGLEAWKRARS